ncbi:MAG: NTP transferase domain-containing protein [Candidatus Omnitrophota bacterium]|nr:MAG: NTP transferase domain-containing protein [Candidatus Omnitrophota bacterium]
MIRAEDLKKFIVSKKASIRDALKTIDANKEGIALIVDEKKRLLGTITDGDIRRFILKNGDIDAKCAKVMNTSFVHTKKDSPQDIKQLMAEYRIRHIPVLGKHKELLQFIVSDTLYDAHREIVAVVMAGGEGRRIQDISKGIPKPLLKIKGKPILEEVILQLKEHHIHTIYLALNYKASAFKEYFRDGSQLGVNLHYLTEKKKLGTAGPLSLLPKDLKSETLLVINGDVLTSTNLRSLIRFYEEHHLLMCVAAKEYVFDIPFGVFNVSQGYLMGIEEKPSQKFFCNAGMYVVNRRVLKFIPKDRQFDMTDLIQILIHKSLPIGVFPLYEHWVDIGNINDYRQAQDAYDKLFKSRSYD